MFRSLCVSKNVREFLVQDVLYLHQSRLHTRRFLECDLPEIDIHGHNVIEGLCMIHNYSF